MKQQMLQHLFLSRFEYKSDTATQNIQSKTALYPKSLLQLISIRNPHKIPTAADCSSPVLADMHMAAGISKIGLRCVPEHIIRKHMNIKTKYKNQRKAVLIMNILFSFVVLIFIVRNVLSVKVSNNDDRSQTVNAD